MTTMFARHFQIQVFTGESVNGFQALVRHAPATIAIGTFREQREFTTCGSSCEKPVRNVD